MNKNSDLNKKNIYDNNTFIINAFTEENLSGFMKYLDLKDKSVLTINPSGDDLLNAAFYGANNLTLCNHNPYTYSYLFLKIAALISLSYNEYCWFFFKKSMNMHPNNKMFSKKLFKKISPVLDYLNHDAYMYFDDIFNLYNAKEIRNNLFVDSDYHSKTIKRFNVYLNNENSYNKLRDNILKKNINFIEENINDVNLTIECDRILLSTLCTEMTLNKFLNLVKKLNNNLSSDGLMVLGYLWNKNVYTKDYDDVWKKIYENTKSNVFLNKYLTDIYEVSGYINYLWENNKKEDKVLVYRKKH